MRAWIECPACGDGQIKVRFVIHPGRGGDRTSPPEAADAEIVAVLERFGCDCSVDWDDLTRAERAQEDRLFEEAVERERGRRERWL